MTQATVFNSAGSSFTVTNAVLNSAGTSFNVHDDVLNSAGTAFTVFSVATLTPTSTRSRNIHNTDGDGRTFYTRGKTRTFTV